MLISAPFKTEIVKLSLLNIPSFSFTVTCASHGAKDINAVLRLGDRLGRRDTVVVLGGCSTAKVTAAGVTGVLLNGKHYTA